MADAMMPTANSTGSSSPRIRRDRTSFFVSYLQAVPLTLVLGFFFLLPILLIIVVSFWDYDFAGIYPDFLTTNYEDTLGSWVTWKIYLNTLKFAVIVWALTLFIGFWVAYFLAFHIRSSAIQSDSVPRLHRSVSDVQHHPHDFLDPGSGAQWSREFCTCFTRHRAAAH